VKEDKYKVWNLAGRMENKFWIYEGELE